MSMGHEELRDELLAAVRARRELTGEDEEYLVGAFLDKLDTNLDARIDARVTMAMEAMPKKSGKGNGAALVLPALGIAVPLTAITLALTNGAVGALIVLWVAIAIVVYVGTHDIL